RQDRRPGGGPHPLSRHPPDAQGPDRTGPLALPGWCRPGPPGLHPGMVRRQPGDTSEPRRRRDPRGDTSMSRPYTARFALADNEFTGPVLGAYETWADAEDAVRERADARVIVIAYESHGRVPLTWQENP